MAAVARVAETRPGSRCSQPGTRCRRGRARARLRAPRCPCAPRSSPRLRRPTARTVAARVSPPLPADARHPRPSGSPTLPARGIDHLGGFGAGAPQGDPQPLEDVGVAGLVAVPRGLVVRPAGALVRGVLLRRDAARDRRAGTRSRRRGRVRPRAGVVASRRCGGTGPMTPGARRPRRADAPASTALDFGASAQCDHGLGQVSRPPGSPIELRRRAAAAAVCRRGRVGQPMSSLARITRRRAMNRGSSPASSIRAR